MKLIGTNRDQLNETLQEFPTITSLVSFVSNKKDLTRHLSRPISHQFVGIFSDQDYGPQAPKMEQVIGLKQFIQQAKGDICFVCEQGVSRSSAAIIYAACLLQPMKGPLLVVEDVFAHAYNIVPNGKMIELFDQMLNAERKLVHAVQKQRKGTRFKKNKPFSIEITVT